MAGTIYERNTFLYSMVVTELKEKDYWFFISDFYKKQIECYLDDDIKLKVKEFVSQIERGTTKQAIEWAKSLVVEKQSLVAFSISGVLGNTIYLKAN